MSVGLIFVCVRTKRNCNPSGEISVGSSKPPATEYGLVVSRTALPPSDALILNTPALGLPLKSHRIRLPPGNHASQSMLSEEAPGGFGGTSWLKFNPVGSTVAGWKKQFPELSQRKVWLIKSLLPSGDQIGTPNVSAGSSAGSGTS